MIRWVEPKHGAENPRANLPPTASLIDPAWFTGDELHRANLRLLIADSRKAHQIDSPALFAQAMTRPTVTDTAPWPVVTAPGTGRPRPRAQRVRFDRPTRRTRCWFWATTHQPWLVAGFALGLALAVAIGVR